MKIKDGFMLRQIADQWVVVPLGERVVEMNGIMTLSESGAFIWKLMENDITLEDIIQAMLAEYSIDEETLRADVIEFISMIKEKGLILNS